MHACDVPHDEDLIERFQDVPFPDDVHLVLSSHVDELQTLLKDLHPECHPDHPVSQYLLKKEQRADSSGGYSIKFYGNLSIIERAQVANWFFHNIPGAQQTIHLWLGCSPLAHAFTLLIAHQEFGQLSTNREERSRQLQTAWEYLVERTGTGFNPVDVDHECLSALEERMFTDSVEAGAAGNQQWGLDAGSHQNGWNPYEGLPSHWNVGDREYSETELKVSCQTTSVLIPCLKTFDLAWSSLQWR